MADGPPRGGLERFTGYLLRRAYVAVAAHTARLLPPDRHVREIVLLSLLEDLGPLSGRDIGELTGLNRTLVVKLVDAVESPGWAVRGPHESDRRSYALTLTPGGTTALVGLGPVLDAIDDAFLVSLDPSERDRLHALLLDLLDDAPILRATSLTGRSSFLVVQAHHRMRAHGATAMESVGLLPREFGALSVLAHAQPCSQADLAARMGVTPPGVVGLVDDLESKGLVDRARSVADRRVQQLRLSEHGATTLGDARRIAGGIQAGIAARLGAEGDEELRALLTRCLPLASSP